MPPWGPVSRRNLVRSLRALGFAGPYSGGRHEFMIRGDIVLTVPNPHRGDISIGLLARILRQAGIPRRDWERT
ncbi:MAG: type II toxin-antitoxin system HicA family toxin [Planctomycetes bacterium]|nr:type II toxin-antitoxin system HicA family toxin [Planctomycetota bacterium]